MWDDRQITDLKEIAVAAGDRILAIYKRRGGIDITFKDDDSPLTEADRLAHRCIVERLESLTPEIPILSEESETIDYGERSRWSRYWLVDPLDGTREFIKGNGEFTVNIALIEDGDASLGVVHVPVSGETYLGKSGAGAWKVDGANNATSIRCDPLEPAARATRVVASRSHRGELVDRLITAMQAGLGETEVVSMGSSLKICLLAEGAADIYPRLAPTSEWDTAAAHAVLSAAGGSVVDTRFKPLRYNQKAELLNPHFLAIADPAFDWQRLLAPSLGKSAGLARP